MTPTNEVLAAQSTREIYSHLKFTPITTWLQRKVVGVLANSIHHYQMNDSRMGSQFVYTDSPKILSQDPRVFSVSSTDTVT